MSLIQTAIIYTWDSDIKERHYYEMEKSINVRQIKLERGDDIYTDLKLMLLCT